MKVERFLSEDDAAVLSRLAENLLRLPNARFFHAERLIEILRTAILLPAHCGAPDYACLNSIVSYRAVGTHDVQTILLACPQDANDSLAAATLLTPMALALFGRATGSIVEVDQPFNRVQFVQVVAIQAPAVAMAASGMARCRRVSE